MTSIIPPGLILIIGALFIPLLRGKVRSAYMLLLLVAGFLALQSIPGGTYGLATLLDQELFLRVDKLSLVFGYVFLITALIGIIYALHVKGVGEHVAAFIYAGSALGVVLAGDFVSLFIFWEIMTIAAVFIIWSGGTRASRGAGLRYFLFHLAGGLSLLMGIILRYFETGSTAFDFIGLSGLSSWLILLGFMVNAAVVPLHVWLVDAYPEASVTGTVFLSMFTTKAAVYVLIRAFPGTELLVTAGLVMVVFPLLLALLENDMRRMLSYVLVNQVGFMVVGVGIGTQLAINGVVGQVFAHLFFPLLFMAVGAVMYRTGTAKATELGGLYKAMPVTMLLYLIGAASLSAMPLFSAFVTKSMIISATGYENMPAVFLLLLFASAGAFLHAGLKLPYNTFFGRDSGKRPPEAPLNMLIAMGLAGFLCIFIGVYPQFLYNLLPFPVKYVPYTADHVVSQLLLLLFATLGFVAMKYTRVYPLEARSSNLDVDWVYRKAGPALVAAAGAPLAAFSAWVGRFFLETAPGFLIWFGKNPTGALKLAWDSLISSISSSRRKKINEQKQEYPNIIMNWSISSAVSFVLLFFAVFLVIFYF